MKEQVLLIPTVYIVAGPLQGQKIAVQSHLQIAVGLYNLGTFNELINTTGSGISSTNSHGLQNDGTITWLINSGTISTEALQVMVFIILRPIPL